MPAGGYKPVTEFPDFADHARIRDFFDAWQRWRGDALVPKRSQVKPGDIPHLMSGSMLLDVLGPKTFIVRYAGSLYQDLYRFDFTGKNYIELTEPEYQDVRAKRLYGVVEQPAAAVWMTPMVDTVDFVGASVPILPDSPDQPGMIMQVLVHLRDLHHIQPSTIAQRHDDVHLSMRFRYLDIGAGLPDTKFEA